jgi:hypothetical protein
LLELYHRRSAADHRRLFRRVIERSRVRSTRLFAKGKGAGGDPCHCLTGMAGLPRLGREVN